MNKQQSNNNPMDLNERLSDHFTLGELVRSGTALRHNIDNTPEPCHVENLRRLCHEVLEPLRRRFGVIRVTSGYRCPELNRRVGGAERSRHLSGEAADLHVASLEVAQKMMKFLDERTPHGELILEHVKKTGVRWIHVSTRRKG